MSTTTRTSRRTVTLVVVATALALLFSAAWSLRPAESAPRALVAAPRLGTVTYTPLGGAPVTVDLSSWRWEGTNPVGAVGGGAGVGKVDFGDPALTQGVGAKSPLLTLQLAKGTHFTNVTVVLFRPGTATRTQQFVFAGPTLSGITQSRASATAKPLAAVTLAISKVTEISYATDGTTETARGCFDTASNAVC